MRISIISDKDVIVYTFNKFHLLLACQNLRLLHAHAQRKAITVRSTLYVFFISPAKPEKEVMSDHSSAIQYQLYGKVLCSRRNMLNIRRILVTR